MLMAACAIGMTVIRILVMKELRLREVNRWVQGQTACGYRCPFSDPSSGWAPLPSALLRPWAPTLQAPSCLSCSVVMPADLQHPFPGRLSSSACSVHVPFLFWLLPRPEGCLREDRGSWAEQPSTNSCISRGSCGPTREGQDSLGLGSEPRADCLPSTGLRPISASG